MDISTTVLELVDYAITHGFIDECDRIWAYNTVIAAIGEQGAPLGGRPEMHASTANGALADRIPTIESSDLSFDLNAVLDELASVAKDNGVVPLTGDGDDGIRGWIMSLLMPRPHEVARTFASLHAKDPQQATSWFYRLCGDVDYVHRKAIANDIKWRTPTQWGELEITINLSKPEKNPRDIARAAHDVSGDTYPRCQLCMENEGYPGRPATSPLGAHPARRNLRIVPLILGGEQWGLQYSPYAYFNEHCIAMSEEHRPMHVDHGTFVRLLDFIKLFPHYFIGSNADLPIVGGSILSHDHFQGGHYVFPMQQARTVIGFEMAGHPKVTCGIIKWPVTVIRLQSDDAASLVAAADHVLEVWRAYSDTSVGIVARDEEGQHSTITPIARTRSGNYELDLALRNNRTTDERPLGIFHPAPALQHIKKENIGLIEVMGMAILPPRLQRELASVGEKMLAGEDFEDDELTAPHAPWARDVLARHHELAPENAEDILKEEVGIVFSKLLEDCGVFKWDVEGRQALNRFIDALQ